MCRQLNRLFVDPYSTTEALYRRPQQWCAWRKVLIRVNPRPTCKSGCRLVWFMLDVQRSNRTCVKRYRIEQPGASQRSHVLTGDGRQFVPCSGCCIVFFDPVVWQKKGPKWIQHGTHLDAGIRDIRMWHHTCMYACVYTCMYTVPVYKRLPVHKTYFNFDAFLCCCALKAFAFYGGGVSSVCDVKTLL